MIYLCKPGGVVLGVLNGIDEGGVSLEYTISDSWKITFDIQRYIAMDGVLQETNYYSSTNEMMELLMITDEERVRFLIDAEPTIAGDGVTEKKTVTAHSIESELSTKFLRQFKVNCGTKDSQEYLVGYYDEDGTFINMNLNPYTNLPIDYIVVQNDYVERLAKVKEEIASLDLNVDPATGLIQNQDTYEYLFDIYTQFPRLACDVQADGTCNIYLNSVKAENAKGFEMYICNLEGVYTKDHLLQAIDQLIEFYRSFAPQLSLIDLAIENAKAAGWSVGDIPEDIRIKKYNFSIDNQDILSFLRQNCSQTMKVIIDFDRYERKVDILDIANTDEEHDTGVFLTFRNLLKSVNIKSSSDDGIKTKFIPTGNNNLGILYANFGENNIVNLDWFMDKINEYGENQYVSRELHDKYHAWKDYRESTPVNYSVNGNILSYPSRRDAYRELTKTYNQYMIDIDAFKNRLPNDGCNIDYTTFPFEDLNIAYKAYVNALETLEQLYMADVGAVSFERSTQTALNSRGQVCTSIYDTFYGYDFNAYYYTIIPNVLNALRMYVYTDETGDMTIDNPIQYDAEKDEWISYPGGNPWYTGDSKRVTENMSDAYLYDMSLYGTVELEAKKKAWQEAAAVLYKPGFVLQNGRVVDPVPYDDVYTYNTADSTGWNRLSDAQKENFTGESAYIKAITEYYDYVSPTERYNTLTKSITKGVIQMAQDAIDALQPELDQMMAEQENIQTTRHSIADEVMLENWSQFTEDDISVIYKLIHEASYNNNNILITSLDDIATTVDAQEELYQDSLIALSEKSQPQLSFTIELDNLFALEEFKEFRDSVQLLNFVRVSIGLYEDEFVKLRIITITKNPLIPTDDLKLTFSNMTYSIQDASDLAHLLGLANSSSSGGSSGGSGGSGGVYGTNDAEITIANNLLNALLGQKTYATVYGIQSGSYGSYDLGMTIADNVLNTLMKSQAFKDAISNSVISGISKNTSNINKIITSSDVVEKFKTGDIVVSGECLTDYIRSTNYNSTTNKGSYLDLKGGTFSYADGKLKYDGSTLTIDGSVKIGSMTGNGMITEIEAVPGKISTAVSDSESRTNSKITQTASEIRSEVSSVEDGLNSKITQTASSIRSEVTDSVNGLQSQITQNADNISLKVSKGDVSSQLSVETGRITLDTGRLIINSGNFQIDSSGTVTATSANLSGTIGSAGLTASDGNGWVRIIGSKVEGGRGSVGQNATWVNFANTVNGSGRVTEVRGRAISLSMSELWVTQNEGDTSVSKGYTGTFKCYTEVDVNGNNYVWCNPHFINGILVSI